MAQSTRRPTGCLPIVDPLEDRALPSHGGVSFDLDEPAGRPAEFPTHRGPGADADLAMPFSGGDRAPAFDAGPHGRPGGGWDLGRSAAPWERGGGPNAGGPSPLPPHAGGPGRDAAVVVVFETAGGGGRGRGPDVNPGPATVGGPIAALGQPIGGGNGGFPSRAGTPPGMPADRDRAGSPAEIPGALPIGPGAVTADRAAAAAMVAAAAEADPDFDAPDTPVAGRLMVAIAGPSAHGVASRLDPTFGAPHPLAPGGASARGDAPATPDPLAPDAPAPTPGRMVATGAVVDLSEESGALPNAGADLITGLLPFDRGSLEQALTRFLQGLEEEPAPPPESTIPGARPFAFVATVLGLEAARRWRARRRWAVAPGWFPGRRGEADALS